MLRRRCRKMSLGFGHVLPPDVLCMALLSLSQVHEKPRFVFPFAFPKQKPPFFCVFSTPHVNEQTPSRLTHAIFWSDYIPFTFHSVIRVLIACVINCVVLSVV